MCAVRRGSKAVVFSVDVWLPGTICGRDCYFLVDVSRHLINNQLRINVRVYFWALGSVPLICVPYHHTNTTQSCWLWLYSEFGN